MGKHNLLEQCYVHVYSLFEENEFVFGVLTVRLYEQPLLVH